MNDEGSQTRARTSEDVRITLENAKLDHQDIQEDLTQVISFDSNFSGTELRLLELNHDVMNAIKVGTRLVVRGENEDPAVLCTDDSTFEMKEAETSNSLLIMDKLLFATSPTKTKSSIKSDLTKLSDSSNNDENVEAPNTDSGSAKKVESRSILHVAHSYFELKKITPILTRLHQILQPTSYKGSNWETPVPGENPVPDSEYFTFNMLLEKLPASQEQIRNYLDVKMKYIELNGKIRILDSEYLLRVLTQILDCVEANSFDNAKISKTTVVSQLNSLQPEVILNKTMNWFFCERADGQNSSSGDICCMNEFEICRYIGGSIVKSAQRFILKDFMSAWQESVPNGLVINFKQLDGIAVCNNESTPAVIWYFPEENLPDKIAERFIILFQTKSNWTQDEIFPYIQAFTSSYQNVGALLTKYSRVHTVKGLKYYSAKHTK